MKGQIIFNTQQLLIREFDLNDTDFILELVNSPKWIEFIGDRNIKTVEDARNYLSTGPLKSYKENKFGLWLVALNSTKEAIGMCGLVKRDYLDTPDIGFAFLPQHLGKGYGFEVASATLDYAKNKLGFKNILAITDTQNIVSIKLLNKLGLRFEKPIQSPQNETLLLFSSYKQEKDQKEIDTLTATFFKVFNNTNGTKPNIRMLESICMSEVSIIKNTTEPKVYSLHNFMHTRETILTDGSLIDFSEEEISHTTNIFDKIAHRFSLYIKTGVLNNTPFETLGMKSIQYIYVNRQWKIASITWSDKV